MAKCPNCGYKLKISDWRPECPKCGVNLMYFRMEERLREDADKAELEHAKSQPRYDRMKAAIYGSPWAIIRLVCLVLPIAALMLPLGKISLELPFYSHTTTVNAISVYNTVSSLDFGLLMQLTKSAVMGTQVKFFMVSLVFILLTVVLILVQLLCVICAFGKKWFPRNMILASIGIVFSTVSAIFFQLSCQGFSEVFPNAFSGSAGVFGIVAVILTFCLIMVMNILIKVKKVEVKYTDVSELYLPYQERPSVIAAQKAAQEAAEKALAQEEGKAQTAPNAEEKEPAEAEV